MRFPMLFPMLLALMFPLLITRLSSLIFMLLSALCALYYPPISLSSSSTMMEDYTIHLTLLRNGSSYLENHDQRITREIVYQRGSGHSVCVNAVRKTPKLLLSQRWLAYTSVIFPSLFPWMQEAAAAAAATARAAVAPQVSLSVLSAPERL